jgi:ubiquinone/menaquinone biosynthesis C-methylase UbiE
MTTSKLLAPIETAGAELAFTGERVVPGKTPQNIFLETQARYVFAGKYVKGQRVLDVASGTGIGTHYLARAGAKSCVGLDADFAAVEYANCSYGSEWCRFALSDATELCVATGSVDVVVSFETIEHLSDPTAFLQECARVLRPGGHFICSTPDRDFFRWMPANPFHISEMTESEFVGLLRGVFPRCSFYGQGATNYPLYVSGMLARRYLSRWLERSRLKTILKRRAVRRPAKVVRDLVFSDADVPQGQHEILPYVRRWLSRFPYLLVTATKNVGGKGSM